MRSRSKLLLKSQPVIQITLEIIKLNFPLIFTGSFRKSSIEPNILIRITNPKLVHCSAHDYYSITTMNILILMCN